MTTNETDLRVGGGFCLIGILLLVGSAWWLAGTAVAALLTGAILLAVGSWLVR